MADLRANWFSGVEALLRERIGLNPVSVHRDHIEDAVRQRMAACGFSDASRYLAWIETHAEELQELIERLVVVESWFFRDVQPFHFLARHVHGHWNPQSPDRLLRLLSIPCGAGEEAFSLSMTLLNMGIEASRFRVDGIDISQHALRQALHGTYAESSFREREAPVADYRSRFFRLVGTNMAVNDALKATVQFRHGNLVDPGILSGEQGYDVIFCRNLLIYLDADARSTALGNLHRLLARDGVLYVGHVEGGAVRGERFESYDAAFPFAFRAVHGKMDVPAVPEATVPYTPAPETTSLAADCPPEAMATAAADPSAELEAARTAANRGRLDEGAALSLGLIAKYPPHADVYCLLGVIRQAQGDAADAEKCFHKALYLDPAHHESLVHLALLANQRGEQSAALNYRRRAEKAKVKA